MFTFWDSVDVLDPLPPPDLSSAAIAGLSADPIASSSIVLHNLSASLPCDGQLSDELSIVIFGASVSAGCGAEAPSHRCHPRWSWPRRLHELLRSVNLNASVHVFAKSAIDPTFFVPCMRQRFRLSKSSIVLLEFESVAMASPNSMTSLQELIVRVRHEVPRATIANVGWPTRIGVRSRMDALYVETAQRLGTDVIMASTAIEEVCRGQNVTRHHLYADEVHPSAAGHMLLAELVLHYVRHVRPIPPSKHLPRHCKHYPQHAMLHARASLPPPPPRLPPPLQAPTRQVQATFDPMCFPTADLLPLPRPMLPAGWQLRDEARAGTGVKKLGYVSTREGTALEFGPLAPGLRCALLDVHLGYLQSWTSDMGAFTIRCRGGCRCLNIPGTWSSRAYPFPTVQTASWAPFWTSVTDHSKHRVNEFQNASVTLFTRFLAFIDPKSHDDHGKCFLSVLHHATDDGRSQPRHAGLGSSSRIRIDSLGVELASCAHHCNLARRSGYSGRSAASLAQSQCTRLQPGYHGPPCLRVPGDATNLNRTGSSIRVGPATKGLPRSRLDAWASCNPHNGGVGGRED